MQEVSRLAISGEELLALCDHPRCQVFISEINVGPFVDVCLWDFGRNAWRLKSNLGGRAFIEVDGFAGSVAGSKMGLREDCIYSLGYRSCKWCEIPLKAHMLVFGLLNLLQLLREKTVVPPIWVFPSNY